MGKTSMTKTSIYENNRNAPTKHNRNTPEKVFTKAPQKSDAEKLLISYTTQLLKDNMGSYFKELKMNAKDYKLFNDTFNKHNEYNITQIDKLNKVNQFLSLIQKIEPIHKPKLVHLIPTLMPVRCYLNAKFVEDLNPQLKKVFGFIMIYHPDMKCLTTELHSLNKDQYGNYYDFTKEHLDKDINTKVFLELSGLNELPDNKRDFLICEYANKMTYYFPSKQFKVDTIRNCSHDVVYFKKYNELIEWINRLHLITPNYN